MSMYIKPSTFIIVIRARRLFAACHRITSSLAPLIPNISTKKHLSPQPTTRYVLYLALAGAATSQMLHYYTRVVLNINSCKSRFYISVLFALGLAACSLYWYVVVAHTRSIVMRYCRLCWLLYSVHVIQQLESVSEAGILHLYVKQEVYKCIGTLLTALISIICAHKYKIGTFIIYTQSHPKPCHQKVCETKEH